ncbi:unnamed protein product, partial [Ectocarpus sp. 12 AP-2014]
EDLSTKWQETARELARRGFTVTNTENALEGALSIREFDGPLFATRFLSVWTSLGWRESSSPCLTTRMKRHSTAL